METILFYCLYGGCLVLCFIAGCAITAWLLASLNLLRVLNSFSKNYVEKRIRTLVNELGLDYDQLVKDDVLSVTNTKTKSTETKDQKDDNVKEVSKKGETVKGDESKSDEGKGDEKQGVAKAKVEPVKVDVKNQKDVYTRFNSGSKTEDVKKPEAVESSQQESAGPVPAATVPKRRPRRKKIT